MTYGRYATLSDVREALRANGSQEPAEWRAKMLHEVPDLPTIPDRGKYLVDKAAGRIVLDLGCTGSISAAIQASARRYYGVDRETAGPEVIRLDLDDDPEQIPAFADVELVIVSELLEHLANPGRFLAALRSKYAGRDTYITVPNAGAYHARSGTHEMVHRDHVAWYSYTTLATLLRRYGYVIENARWYNGQPHNAEGLLVLTR